MGAIVPRWSNPEAPRTAGIETSEINRRASVCSLVCCSAAHSFRPGPFRFPSQRPVVEPTSPGATLRSSHSFFCACFVPVFFALSGLSSRWPLSAVLVRQPTAIKSLQPTAGCRVLPDSMNSSGGSMFYAACRTCRSDFRTDAGTLHVVGPWPSFQSRPVAQRSVAPHPDSEFLRRSPLLRTCVAGQPCAFQNFAGAYLQVLRLGSVLTDSCFQTSEHACRSFCLQEQSLHSHTQGRRSDHDLEHLRARLSRPHELQLVIVGFVELNLDRGLHTASS